MELTEKQREYVREAHHRWNVAERDAGEPEQD